MCSVWVIGVGDQAGHHHQRVPEPGREVRALIGVHSTESMSRRDDRTLLDCTLTFWRLGIFPVTACSDYYSLWASLCSAGPLNPHNSDLIHP